ncbi:hypothetical protein J3U99_20725 [Brucella pituitosa]|uniref:phage adaptor protein n=1 Tax=Brucella pituitosa TaxID=571256 RepID=UPI002002A710|nr:hypothetical protein [Brucella pituitosa]MCK4207196.1 hypothetical protein [Brucella pituitosa]
MTVKDALTNAASRIMGVRPTVFFSSTNALEGDLTELVNAVAKDIIKSHDWRVLTKLCTLTGNGDSEGFDLPPDYDRMQKGSGLRSATAPLYGYQACVDPDEWLMLQMPYGIHSLGRWIKFGGQIHIMPKPVLGQEIKFFYQSNEFATDENGTPKAIFEHDNDLFRLDEELLTLGLIWRYRQQKRIDYTDDQALFEKRFNELAGEDKGARVFVEGRSLRAGNALFPYWGQLG